jgi:hypothetical protein
MKKFTLQARIIALFLASVLLFSSCASTTLIDSIPSNAELFLDGEFVGVTPYSMTDTKIIGTCTSVRIEKENHHNFHTSICRNEEIDPGAIIGGIFFWFPFLWAMKYKPTHFYKLQSKNNSDDSLDQLWKSDSNSNEMDNKSGVIRLNEAQPISPDQYEEEKSKIPE